MVSSLPTFYLLLLTSHLLPFVLPIIITKKSIPNFWNGFFGICLIKCDLINNNYCAAEGCPLAQELNITGVAVNALVRRGDDANV